MSQTLTSQVSELGLRSPRAFARSAAIEVLSATQRLTRRQATALATPRIQHLFLHHVFDDEIAGFERLLRDLAEDHVFISYSESVERLTNGTIDRPYLALSFDDGLASCTTAARILTDMGISACFFVVVDMIGETDYAKVDRFCRERLAMPATAFLSWNDLEEFRSSGHEIGSHTRTHARLRDLDGGGLAAELDGSQRILSERLGEARHFAWPYGHFDDAFADVTARARAAGYVSCAANERGAHTTGAEIETLCIRRDHVLANWPPRHVRWFLARNAMRSSPSTNVFPS